jgi:hypothetical protein
VIIAPKDTLAQLALTAGAGVTEFYLAPRSSSASHASCMIALALVSLSPFCLSRHRSTAARKPDMKERLATLGYDLVSSTPKEFATRIAAEIEMWAKVIRAANIKAE